MEDYRVTLEAPMRPLEAPNPPLGAHRVARQASVAGRNLPKLRRKLPFADGSLPSRSVSFRRAYFPFFAPPPAIPSRSLICWGFGAGCVVLAAASARWA